MKQIALSGKHGIGKFALVDDEDFEMVNKLKWYADKNEYTFYAKRTDRSSGKRKNQLLHRVIMNANENNLVDHKDRNGLNCQRNNLRECSRLDNNRNSKSRKNTTSEYKGVSLKRENKWCASIGLNGKSKHLGYFKTENEAAKCYDLAAIKYHGEFANLNFKQNGK